jgi:uncharacterized protein
MNVDYETLFADTPVLVAYLFGSRADGRERTQSDYDVGVLLQENLTREERSHWQLELIGRLMDAHHADRIDLVILNGAPPLLCYEVIRRRHVLFNRDDEARVTFEVRALQEWFDWAPRYRHMQREMLREFASGVRTMR